MMGEVRMEKIKVSHCEACDELGIVFDVTYPEKKRWYMGFTDYYPIIEREKCSVCKGTGHIIYSRKKVKNKT